MFKHMLAAVAIMALVGSVGFVEASGGSGSGGGGSGGNSASIRYVGLVNGLVDAPEGVYVTIGTSYYNTGTVLVTPSTKVTLYNQNATIEDLDLGDYVEIAATTRHVAVRLNIVTP